MIADPQEHEDGWVRSILKDAVESVLVANTVLGKVTDNLEEAPRHGRLFARIECSTEGFEGVFEISTPKPLEKLGALEAKDSSAQLKEMLNQIVGRFCGMLCLHGVMVEAPRLDVPFVVEERHAGLSPSWSMGFQCDADGSLVIVTYRVEVDKSPSEEVYNLSLTRLAPGQAFVFV